MLNLRYFCINPFMMGPMYVSVHGQIYISGRRMHVDWKRMGNLNLNVETDIRLVSV